MYSWNKTAMKMLLLSMVIVACHQETSDSKMRDEQEKILEQANAAVGIPPIGNFFEKKNMAQILTLRDDPNYLTFTYVFNEHLACYRLLAQSVGYPFPYSTQFTNPMKVDSYTHGPVAYPQAEPNGLFSPESAEASFVMVQDPTKSDRLVPLYSEPRLTTVPYQMPENLLCPKL